MENEISLGLSLLLTAREGNVFTIGLMDTRSLLVTAQSVRILLGCFLVHNNLAAQPQNSNFAPPSFHYTVYGFFVTTSKQ